MLNKEVMEKKGLSIKGILLADSAFTCCFFLLHGISLVAYNSPQIEFLRMLFLGLVGYLIIAIITIAVPPIIELIINIRFKIKKTKKEIHLAYSTISLLTWFIITGFPTNIFQFIFFLISLFLVHIGLSERFPILRFNMRFNELIKRGYEADKILLVEVKMNSISIFTAICFYLIGYNLHIYPLIFLPIYYLKYPIKRYIFPKRIVESDSIDFYKRLKWIELILIIPFFISISITMIFFGIAMIGSVPPK